MRSGSAPAISRRRCRSRRRRRSSVPVASSIASAAARASSSAISGTRSESALALVDEVLPEPPVLVAVEVVGAHLGEQAHELRMGDAAGEGLALEPLPRVDQPRRGRRTGGGAARASQLNGEAEPVVSQPPRVVALGRLRDPVQDVLDAQVRVLLVARAVELEPHAVDRIRLGLGQAAPRSRPDRRRDPCPSEARRRGSRSPGAARAPCREASPPLRRRRSRSRERRAS